MNTDLNKKWNKAVGKPTRHDEIMVCIIVHIHDGYVAGLLIHPVSILACSINHDEIASITNGHISIAYRMCMHLNT